MRKKRAWRRVELAPYIAVEQRLLPMMACLRNVLSPMQPIHNPNITKMEFKFVVLALREIRT